jgi:hypothetical protein
MASDAKSAANGRPVEYTAEIGETICGRLVEGESLRKICADAGMPDVATVLGWATSHRKFRNEYELARGFQAQDLLDESLEIIDDSSGYWVEKVQANGRVVVVEDRKQLPRCRLRAEVRMWVAGQLAPLGLVELLQRIDAQRDTDNQDEAAKK